MGKVERNVSGEVKTPTIKIHKRKIAKRIIKKKARLSQDSKRGLVYLGHIPHGFYEEELKNYFKQHGTVTNVKVGRSATTGNSKGFAYVEFKHNEVAKIVAETMNNYLMFKKRLVAKYVPPEERPKHIFHGKSSTTSGPSSTKRRRSRYFATKNEEVDEESQTRKTQERRTKMDKKMVRLGKYGIKYNLTSVE